MSGLLKGLRHLINERRREIEERQARLAQEEQQRRRLMTALDKLDGFGKSLGASGSNTAPLLAGNSAAYKQSLLEMAERQRQDLQLKDADLAVQRQQLGAVARDEQALGLLATRLVERERRARAHGEQKRQDELAAQVWQRRSHQELKNEAAAVALSSGQPDFAGEHHG